VIYNIIADKNNGCKINVNYESPVDGLVKAEAYVGVKELKNSENIVHFVGV
jgi:hypothetical protein